MKNVQLFNASIADKVLTEIQNGTLSKVKQDQISQMKNARNELKDIFKLNKKILQEQTDIEETKQPFNSKYHGYFNKEAEKNGEKYKDKEELKEDIGTFIGDVANHPEVLAKKLNKQEISRG